MNETEHIIVVGSGVAGSAIAYELSKRGYQVSLLYREEEEGSSFTNQKWNHSGLLYPEESLAKKACIAFLEDSILRRFTYPTRQRAKFLALHEDTFKNRKLMWSNWNVKAWGLDWRVLEQQEYQTIGTLGNTHAIGGFEVPDCVVDFPSLIRHLREETFRKGGNIISKANVKRIQTIGNRVVGVEYIIGSELHKIECSKCLVATGAWSNKLLEESGIATLNLIFRKCIVFEYPKELVPGITSCLDIWRHDGTKQDVTLVPFNGKTIAAGTGFKEVVTGDDTSHDKQEVERLTDQLVQCFPKLATLEPRIFTCTKTEQWPGGKPNVNPHLYDFNFHGVGGLFVAIPGKASFMFDLASEVIAEITTEDK